MQRSHFIPARNGRHRTAALALYRSLVREGGRVPVPPQTQPGGSMHPVVYLIKKRFAANRSCSSARLLYAAMTAGYQVRIDLQKLYLEAGYTDTHVSSLGY